MNSWNKFAMKGFALILAYMMFSVIWLAVKGVEELDAINFIFFTVGLYFLASFMHSEPWHMFTSFIQYLLLLPSYSAVLNMYAFAHFTDFPQVADVHNESIMETDAGSNTFVLELPKRSGTDAMDESVLTSLLPEKLTKEPAEEDGQADDDDYDAEFGTEILINWASTNLVLVFIVLTYIDMVDSKRERGASNFYMRLIIVSFAVLTLIRFSGSMAYLIMRWRYGRRVLKLE